MDYFDEEEEEVVLVPRPYQTYLLEQAIKQNTILFLPTGSGKTYVAIMLIQHLSYMIDKPYSAGGKRTFFMVNTVALVNQQAESIRKHTPYTVGTYSGDKNVDYWLRDRWELELEEHQILVMTSQIFVDMLSHSYIQLSSVNLLIFDECHHGVNDHPMRQIMKLFENIPVRDQPRVLGLSATLIMGSCKLAKVPEEVLNLEKTFHSKVATVSSMHVVEKFSTNPKESIVPFREVSPCKLAKEAIDQLSKFQNEIALIKWPSIEIDDIPTGTTPIYNKVKTGKNLKNLLCDLSLHIEMLGIYGGSKACLAHLIHLERRRIRAENEASLQIHTALISGVTMINWLLEKEMDGHGEKDKVLIYSSDKVLTLLKILSEQNCSGKNGDQFCGVIFVQRRFTAKILYYILKAMAVADPKTYGFIKPDFVVGLNVNPMQDTREGRLEQKNNDAVIWRFNHDVSNLLVSSDVLEEGIDIPKLSLVVRFDTILNPTSYIQSKGRARHVTSNFKMMVPFNDCEVFRAKFNQYQQVEKMLINFLVGKNDTRRAPTQKDIDAAMSDLKFPPYYASGVAGEGSSCITIASAVSLVTRYCSTLPHDRYTCLQPSWFIDNKGVVYLRLPMSCPLKELIPGQPGLNKRNAKRTAALEACKRLHQMGELNEKLLPKDAETVLLEEDTLFPTWEDEDQDDEADAWKIGTHKKLRQHPKKFPCALSECCPKPETTTYVHNIRLSPTYAKPAKNRRAVFYDYMDSDRGYAILSSKPLPQVCDFSIYLNIGEVNVVIETNAVELRLTADQIKLAKNFTAMIFNEVLSLEKSFLICDVGDAENAYLVVPMAAGHIDWDVVKTHRSVPRVSQPSLDEQREMQIDQGYLHAVIAPWYRCSDQIQAYVVTKVCDDVSPRSPFPTAEFTSYKEYFSKKYSVTILNRDQPLVEVKAISSKMHCLKPRIIAESKTQSKRRRQDLNEDFEEHLVPELCMRFAFPAVLWLKATCLPTVLHRLMHLLLAEQLRVDIASETSLGAEALPPSGKWDRLTVDSNCESFETQPETLLGVATAGATKQLQPDRLWGEEKEPVDIERRRPEEVLLAEIQYYERFVNLPLPSSPTKSPKERIQDIPVRKINILSREPNGIGPQQSEILQALTATTANDIMNLERSETLGDSFLKFAISLYLYHQYPNVDEGKLTGLKGKLVGNRHLFYCGRTKGLPGKMKVNDFSPSSDFLPPSMCVPRFVKQVFLAADLSPNLLLALNLPRDERLNGKLSAATVTAIQTQLVDAVEDIKSNSTMETFLGLHTVKDKTVSDCVEALIGTYLKSCGIRGALTLLGWLKVLPADTATPTLMFDQKPPSALLVADGDVYHHLRACSLLERDLGYTFKDKSFLLQALTHPSFEANRITESYQRLEFLGDSLIDFLVTCHIYERCGSMTPGQLTDLRSALVNNIYFASVVVRLGLHKYMLFSSPKLHELITSFVTIQQERNHAVSEQVLFLIEESETKEKSEANTDVAECIDVPKALGDLLEALIGAVYLDSNMSLDVVWTILYRLMHKELDAFSKNIPKQPVRLLYERLGNNKPIFHRATVAGHLVMVELEILVDGVKKNYIGIGNNKILAKTAAAKIAIKGLGMQA